MHGIRKRARLTIDKKTFIVGNMPIFHEISPSKESEHSQHGAITVVNRSIEQHSRVKKHRHTWGQFIYAHAGVMLVETEVDRLLIPPEQGVWVTPEVEHQVSAITDVELTSFYFGSEVIEALPTQCCVLRVNSFLSSLIYEARNTAPDYQWDDADGLLLRLIVSKLSDAQIAMHNVPLPKDARLLKMLAMLLENPAINLSLEAWGSELGASTRTLSRLFKRETGLSYVEWKNRLKIQIAISQMAKGESISNVSMLLGYNSHSAFSHMFKQITGMTPSFYNER